MRMIAAIWGCVMLLLSNTPALAKTKAKPAMQIGGFISDHDYPADAIAAGQEGAVTTAFTIGVDGKPNSCTAKTSSNSPALDQISCAIVTQRFRFRPARDAMGAKVNEPRELVFAWRLSQKSPPCPQSVGTICITRD